MGFIDMVFGTFFGYLIQLCYSMTDNFGWTLVVFTLLTKAILFPISLISQKNSIIMVKLQPLLSDLQARYESEPEVLIKEQKALYKKENYSTIKAILPLLVQIPLIIGVISVVNNPTRHLTGDINHIFYGLDLFVLPEGLFIPALAIVSTILLCVIQNKYNVISREQGFFGKWGVMIFLVALTGWFVFICPAGLGLYWTFSNLSGIAVLAICNIIYNPKKYINYENRSVKAKLTKEEKLAARERRKREKAREKEDMQRFFSTEKELVFFSESSGFYKYFQCYIEYILENSDITVHYLTADINDQVFGFDKPRFEAYFCSSHGLITTFMKMDSDIVAMTMPDLDVYHYKRSLVRKDIEYVHIEHAIGSMHLSHRKGALDNYDTIFCFSKNINEEIRATEKTYSLPEKKLVNVGYGLLDTMIESYESYCSLEHSKQTKPQILLAPSWQKDNILEYCLDPLLESLFELSAKITVRPHPEFVKRFPGKMKLILEKYGDRVGEDFKIQTDFTANFTVYESDLIITDWSAIAQEFSLTTKKPSLFINTPMKIMNLEWQKIGIEPMDIWIRDKIGVSLDTDKLETAKDVVQDLLENTNKHKEAIEDMLSDYIYEVGNAAQSGGGYIIKQIEERRNSII